MNMLNNATQTMAFVDALFEALDRKPLPEPRRECEINGNRVPFDYCSKFDLEKSIEFYDNALYIGSGRRVWYDGISDEFEELHHFFILKACQPIAKAKGESAE